MTCGPLNVEALRAALRTRRVGTRMLYFAETTSTNDEAWRCALSPGADGTVVLAEYQSAGRGRFGRNWNAPRGAGLLMSVLLIEQGGDPSSAELCLIPAVAACEAIETVTGVRPTIHWPNDLYVGRRKLAGILVEARRPVSPGVTSASVLGMGINCLQHAGHFPPELGNRATSLEMESRHAVDRTALAVELLNRLDYWLALAHSWKYAQLREAWISRAEPVGRQLHLRCQDREYSGTIVDIDPAFALVLRLDDGTVRAFAAAETTVSPPL